MDADDRGSKPFFIRARVLATRNPSTTKNQMPLAVSGDSQLANYTITEPDPRVSWGLFLITSISRGGHRISVGVVNLNRAVFAEDILYLLAVSNAHHL